jgi:outer membrane biosynthesis protein TonB
MNFAATKTVAITLLVVVVVSGCRKKKEPTVTPQAQAPTVGAPQKPGTTTQKEPTQPAATPPSTSAPAAPSTATTPKPKPKRAPKPPKQEPSATATNGNGQTAAPKTAPETPSTTASTTTPPAATPPPKVVVQDGGEGGETPSGQISTGGNNHSESRQSVEQLLQSTDSNLRSISRPLNDEERAMVEQIRNYMAQARVASTDGDLTRANNLALKAHLLSDELVKR